MKKQELPIIQATYDLILWAIPHIQKFPRNHRFSLGVRMEDRLYSLLESLIDARYKRQKRGELLSSADGNLNVLRYLVRLSHDLKLVGFRQYDLFSTKLVELGKQLGGWIGEMPDGPRKKEE